MSDRRQAPLQNKHSVRVDTYCLSLISAVLGLTIRVHTTRSFPHCTPRRCTHNSRPVQQTLHYLKLRTRSPLQCTRASCHLLFELDEAVTDRPTTISPPLYSDRPSQSAGA